MNSKYSKFLTILLVIVIVAIVGIVGFLGYKYYKSVKTKNNSEDFVGSFLNDSNVKNSDNDTDTSDMFSGIDESTADGTSGKVKKYNGFVVAGTIEIPATKLSCPIISKSEYSKSALETSVVEIYGPGLNKVGNTTIAGHNYRNGNFFSNNKKLNIGDKIYITDLDGNRVCYSIYNKYEGTDTESDYMTRDTNGAREISLSTCTDDSKARLIIWAKADE